MKKTTLNYDVVDSQFLKATSQILDRNKDVKLKPYRATQLSMLIYSNSTLISDVRGSRKRVPHRALVKFADVYGIDMNYFYNADLIFDYNPEIGRVVVSNPMKQDNVVVDSSNASSLASSEQTQSLINQFLEDLPKERIPLLINLVSKLKKEQKILELDYKQEIKKLVNHIRQLYLQLDEVNRILIDTQRHQNELLMKVLSLKIDGTEQNKPIATG